MMMLVMICVTTSSEDDTAASTNIAVQHIDDAQLVEDLLNNKEKNTCLAHIGSDFLLVAFEQGDEWGLCVTPGVTSTDSAPSLLSSADSQLVSVAAVDVDLVVQVHASLSDAAANASACLPVETSRGQCTFRSAVELCASHLTAEDRNCTIVLSPADDVRLDAAFGQMPRVSSGLGSFSVLGKGSSFSLAGGSSSSSTSLQLLFVASSVAGDLRFTMTDCHVSHFGNETLVGGAVHLSGVVSSRIENCVFSNNTGHMGGAVYIGNSNSHVDIIDCSFRRNLAASLGGGLYVGSFNNDFLLQNVSFTNNTAFSGGGLFVNNDNSDFRFFSCVVLSNVVSNTGGGGFLNNDNIRFVLKHCDFIENTALDFYAGGLYLYSRNQVELHFVRFVGNLATYGGGLNGDSDNDYTLMSNCYFERNIAAFGGALTFYASHVFLVIQNTTFHMNHASISGGAMYFGVNNDDFLLQDLHFSNNTAAVCPYFSHMRCRFVLQQNSSERTCLYV